jgi:hypothetical protein
LFARNTGPRFLVLVELDVVFEVVDES